MDNQTTLFALQSPSKSLTQKRNDAIRADYFKRTKTQHLDSSYVVSELSKKYWLEEQTIWLIVLKQGYYKEA